MSPQVSIHSTRMRRHWRWHLLLILPFVGTLWVPFFNAVEPRAFGIPYFYWYQFLWVGISAGLTAVVYFATRDGNR
jgi:Protein of unknown function (DUF3311)